MFNISFNLTEFKNRIHPSASQIHLVNFLRVLLQAGVLGWLWIELEVEPSSGFSVLFPVAAAGIVINHLLPVVYRILFSTLLTIGVAYFIFGWISGSLLVAGLIGCILISVLHIPLWMRIIMLTAAFLGMAVLRLEIVYMPRVQIIVPFLAAFLMFRLIVFMYDVKKNEASTNVLYVLGYFFMLPNFCFLLFPIVDYKTFTKSYYAREPIKIYTEGIRRISLGLLNIFIFRLVFHYMYVPPMYVQSASDAALFLISGYLMLTRIVAIFLIPSGWLSLLGYDLPLPFGKIYFAHSYDELWRRINVYWKDFVVKIVYNPFFTWFKKFKFSMETTIVISVIAAFWITTYIHSWQQLWVQGKFSASVTDHLYWIGWGALVAFSSVVKRNPVPYKVQNYQVLSFFESVGHARRVLTVFLVMSVLTSFWYIESLPEWWFFMAKFGTITLHEAMLFSGVILGVLTLYIIYLKIHAHVQVARWLTNAWVPFLMVVFLSAGFMATRNTSDVCSNLTQTRPGTEEMDNVELGYYDAIVGVESRGRMVWETLLNRKRPEFFNNQDRIHERTGDVLTRRLKKNVSVIFKGKKYTTNSFGMRDKEYDFSDKKSHVKRFAMLGASYLTGYGVNDGESFEAQTEDSLNAVHLYNYRYEMLNLGVGGYNLIQQVYLAEHEVVKYDCDFIVLSMHTKEKHKIVRSMVNLVRNGVELKYKELLVIKRKSGVKQYMSHNEMFNRLYPYADEIIKWGYARIARASEKMGAKPVLLYIPTTFDKPNQRENQSIFAIAKAQGFEILDLAKAYRGKDIKAIRISEKDHHPNKWGHTCLARELLLEIKKNTTTLGL
ncbi:MAG: SGNH/GDSL hydrolase family protein [Flavobacteriales bacterium]